MDLVLPADEVLDLSTLNTHNTRCNTHCNRHIPLTSDLVTDGSVLLEIELTTWVSTSYFFDTQPHISSNDLALRPFRLVPLPPPPLFLLHKCSRWLSQADPTLPSPLSFLVPFLALGLFWCLVLDLSTIFTLALHPLMLTPRYLTSLLTL